MGGEVEECPFEMPDSLLFGFHCESFLCVCALQCVFTFSVYLFCVYLYVGRDWDGAQPEDCCGQSVCGGRLGD